jgi:hypothetical protein
VVERRSGRRPAAEPAWAALVLLLVCLRRRLVVVVSAVGVVFAVVGAVFAVVEGVVFVGAGVVVGFAVCFRLGFAGWRGEAVPGAALVDAVDQDGRADLGEGAGQAGVAEPDRLGVDRRLPGQGLGRVELPPGQARGA